MCIRDSDDRGAGRYAAEFVEMVDFVACEDRVLLLPKGRACLLYTSDAADERSSVDLGGSRIIKKKKHSS